MQYPQGWHPDPTQRHQLRFWDGGKWTEHVSDNSNVSVDYLDPSIATPASSSWIDQARQATVQAANDLGDAANQAAGAVNDRWNAPTQPPAAGQQAAPAQAAPAPASSEGGLGEQLRKLAALRDEGLLTDDEFAEQKKKILDAN